MHETDQGAEYVNEGGLAQEHATATEHHTGCVLNDTVKYSPETLGNWNGSATSQRLGLKKCARGDIELQFTTLTEYDRTKKLRPIEWICCACSKEQKYRYNLEPLDRLRCQYPKCGVSDKGFRIYRVHDLCDQCTVLVDQRDPVTRKSLKQKRDDLRQFLKSIKKIYEDVDRLVEFDKEEAAEYMEDLLEKRKSRENFERQTEEENAALHRAEMERQRMDECAYG